MKKRNFLQRLLPSPLVKSIGTKKTTCVFYGYGGIDSVCDTPEEIKNVLWATGGRACMVCGCHIQKTVMQEFAKVE